MRRVLRQDLFWALYLLCLGAAFGLMQHWQMVRLSHRGELRSHLEKARQERREVRFQGVKTVTLDQAHDFWQQGQTLFLDARELDEYQEQHVTGALHFPPKLLDQPGAAVLEGVPKERRILVYCGQENCDVALKVAKKLQDQGFTNVYAFLGGFRAWDEAGHPTATGR
ncbi:MAG: rhodanese-like domain-containing protein [Deltaproteobacteria bacterium]|nr:rhodanese-like domain-containing protein [Deltaproteobacteria bacterium]